MMNDDLYGLPEELSRRPVPFVGLFGLDIVKNTTHRYIWEAFNKNQNTVPIAVKIIQPNHQFPRVKPNKNSNDRSYPKGILKRNWMKKHLTEIPAVVVIFLNSNWDDPNWDINESKCIQQILDVKKQLGQLKTKVAIVVVQRVPPLPADEDTSGQKRANALCNACDVTPKQLFVVPQEEHLPGYVVRLQSALFELAKDYYNHEIKLVKDKLSSSNKTHQYLFYRYNFKIGFLSELAQDDHTARSSYGLAFSRIKNEPLTGPNLFEIKLVAGFISYKFCACMFRLGVPREALTQFRKLIGLYKQAQGPAALLFEHYAWLAYQYANFANIFDDAIRLGLSAIQTEHPGIYYRQAALYTIDRKIVAKQICENVVAGLTDVPLMEFWGQRFGFDLNSDGEGVRILQAREKTVDHSAIIIGFLGSGISQFKTYKCPRMRLQLMIQMAEEYHAAQDYGKTLTVLSHMLWDYRNERWWMLLGALLQLGLSSAFLSASLQDYLVFGIEALGSHIPIDLNLKKTIAHNIHAIIQKRDNLSPHPGGSEPDISKALSLWTTALAKNPSISIDLSNVRNLINVHVKFAQKKYPINQPVDFQITLSLDFLIALEIDHVTAVLSTGLNIESKERNIVIQNGSAIFHFLANGKFETGHTIKISSVIVHLSAGLSVTLKITPITSKSSIPEEFAKFRKTEEPTNEALIISPIADIKLKIIHESPALLGEQFPIQVIITNSDKFDMNLTQIEVKLLTAIEESSADASTRLSDENETSISPRKIKTLVGTIPGGSDSKTTIFLKGYSTGDRNIQFTVRYSNDNEGNQQLNGLVEQQTIVRVCNPFNVTTECLTTKFSPTLTCYAHETFLLCTDVLITSPCPITIQHSTLELSVREANDNTLFNSQLAGVTLYPGDTGRDIFPVTLMEPKDQTVAIGTYVLQWSRQGKTNVTSSSVTIKPIRCQQSVLSINLSLPAHGRVRTPMQAVYTLYNRTSMLLQLDMYMEASEAFMYSGLKHTVLRLLPECEKKITYSLCPLWSGLLALPRMLLNSSDQGITEQLTATLHRNLPSHVYIMPQEKTETV